MEGGILDERYTYEKVHPRKEYPLTSFLKVIKTSAIAVAFVLFIAACVSEPQQGDEPPEPTLDQSQINPAATETEPLQWDKPPELTFDQSKIYLATLETEKGDIQIELFADRAPITVNNFIFLAENGYYDGTTFHRVLEGFMAQGGDPTGTGGGGPGYRFADEIDFDLFFDEAGYLAMANGGPDTNGSQFFITYGPTLHLNGNHTIFGKVVDGMDVALALTLRNPSDQSPPQFEGDILKRVRIEEIPESLLPPPAATPIPLPPEPEDGRPLASLPVIERENLYSGKPDMVINPSLSYQAIVRTTQGEFVIKLDSLVAPESANNFVVLAELGFYDGFPISFVDPGELVLFGSPAQDPGSDVGYGIPMEFGMERRRGSVGFWFRQEMLRLSGSQIYIFISDAPGLSRYFTVFAEVVQGMDVVEQLTLEDTIELIAISIE
jgi:cyclophilin family peptidyl-prolyl cis-trans isomerase